MKITQLNIKHTFNYPTNVRPHLIIKNFLITSHFTLLTRLYNINILAT